MHIKLSEFKLEKSFCLLQKAQHHLNTLAVLLYEFQKIVFVNDTRCIYLIADTEIVQYWEKLDANGNTIRRFYDNEQISVGYDDIASLAYNISFYEPMGRPSSFHISCFDNPTMYDITSNFQQTNVTEKGSISETGTLVGNIPNLAVSPLRKPFAKWFLFFFFVNHNPYIRYW